VWSWWQPGSVHRAAWPTASGATGEQRALDAVCEVLGQIRRTKTEAKVSQRAAIAVVQVTATQDLLDLLALGENDLIDAGSIISLTTQASDIPGIEVAIELAPAGTEFQRDHRS
jgi:valyl-tRNA synthetase